MDTIEIVGGNRLAGSVRISGAKNAALPIMTAALLADGEHVFRNVPNLRDVHTMTRLLGCLGVAATYENGRVHVSSTGSIEPTAPYELVKQMHDDLYDGLKEEVEEGVHILLERGWTPYKILTEALVEGMRIVGIDFRDGILFVPEVLLAARAMKAGMGLIEPLLAADRGAELRPALRDRDTVGHRHQHRTTGTGDPPEFGGERRGIGQVLVDVDGHHRVGRHQVAQWRATAINGAHRKGWSDSPEARRFAIISRWYLINQ